MKFFDAQSYQPACEALFNHYRDKVISVLPDAKVEHVGASSIPGAISKGDLDIFVGVDGKLLEQAVELLKPLGFEEKLATLRTPQLCMLESQTKHDVALQVVALGSEFEFFLTFRDRMRADAKLVEQYNALKQSCQGLSQQVYRQRKSAFVEQVLAQ